MSDRLVEKAPRFLCSRNNLTCLDFYEVMKVWFGSAAAASCQTV